MNSQDIAVKEVEFHKLLHVIKNSLTICDGYLSLLQVPSSIEESKYLQIVKEELKRTLHIMKEYKENSQTEEKIEEIDLGYLIEDVINTFRFLFEKNDCKIVFLNRRKYYIKGNYNQLKQVFINLLKNAYEAKTSTKLIITVRIISSKEYYKVIIKDTGTGMNEQELDQIGKNYYTTKEQGTGLGVSYCKEIMKKHKGDILYHSEKNAGTTVTVMLPKKKSPKTFNNNSYYYYNKLES